MSRSSPFLNKPQDGFAEDVALMRSTPLFLVSTTGPTVFIIKTGNPSTKPFKVYIGSNQRCSCGGGEGRGKLCLHILYVMIKVLRVPETNPLSWQISLVDSEVTNILSGRGSSDNAGGATDARRSSHSFLRRRTGSASGTSASSTSSSAAGDKSTGTDGRDT